jgi:hypothetical protein
MLAETSGQKMQVKNTIDEKFVRCRTIPDKSGTDDRSPDSARELKIQIFSGVVAAFAVIVVFEFEGRFRA